MSQITSQYGESFISGLLAGQKMRQFQSDLKTSEIQRQLLEQEMGYKQTMQPLLMAHQQAQLDREKTLNEGSLLANKLAAATYGDAVAESGSRARGADAQARGAAADADVAEATKGSRISGAASKAGEAKAQMLQEQFKSLGILGETGVQFGPADIPHLSTQIFGPPSGEKATDSLRDQMAGALLAQGKQRYDMNQSTINTLNAQRAAEAESRRAMALQNEITGGRQISDLFSQVEPEVGAKMISKLEAGGKLSPADYAKIAVSSYNRRSAEAAAGNTTVTMDPAEIESQKELGKNIETLYSQLNAAKRAKKELESGRSLADNETTWTSTDAGDRKRLVKVQEDQIAELEDQIKSQEGRKKSVTKTTEKSGAGTSKSSDIPLITTKVAYDKLPAGARYRETAGGPIFIKPGN